MTFWFTADQHFGHANIIKYCNRPFDNADEMDEALIAKWNERVGPSDTVFHLGDFTLGNATKFNGYLNRLRGVIYIVPGGHDSGWVKSAPNLLLPPLVTRNFDGHKMTLCHYPMLSWEQSHYGAHHLHGHTHGTIGVVGASGDKSLPPEKVNGKRLDVGVDCHGFAPISLDEVLGLLAPRTTSAPPSQDDTAAAELSK